MRLVHLTDFLTVLQMVDSMVTQRDHKMVKRMVGYLVETTDCRTVLLTELCWVGNLVDSTVHQMAIL